MAIYKRKSGKYAVSVDLPRGPNGKRRRRPLGTYLTRKEAQKVEREALLQRDRGIGLNPERVSVKELVERYVDDREAKGRAIRTTSRYRDILRSYIDPKIGSLPISKLAAVHVSDMLNWWRRSLSPKSVSHIRSLLHGALDWGVKHDLVNRNVVDMVDTITVPHVPASALSEAEAQILIRTCDPLRFGAFLRFALATGARRGEICALRWTDISMERNSVTIERAAVEATDAFGKRVQLIEKTTKSGKARVMPLNHLALGALRQQYTNQLEDKMKNRKIYEDSGHVFQSEVGGPITPYSATDAFRKLCAKVGIKASLHTLRHTFATWLLRDGVDVKTVSAVLGHANASVTLNVYAHLLPGAAEEAITAIDRRLQGVR